MRIALFGDELLAWQGGQDFFRILFKSIKLGSPGEDEVTIATCIRRDSLPWRVARVGKHLLSKFPRDYRWMAHEMTRGSRTGLIRRLTGEKTRFVYSGRKDFGAQDFDVAGPFMSPPDWIEGNAWIGYLFDCQHKRLPYFFSEQERAARDHQFATLLRAAPIVIVHSEDVKADLIHHFSAADEKIIALPFAAAADASWFRVDPTLA